MKRTRSYLAYQYAPGMERLFCCHRVQPKPRNLPKECPVWDMAVIKLKVSTHITSNLSFSVFLYLIRFIFSAGHRKPGSRQAAGLQMLRSECGQEMLGKGESRLELQVQRTESLTQLLKMDPFYDVTFWQSCAKSSVITLLFLNARRRRCSITCIQALSSPVVARPSSYHVASIEFLPELRRRNKRVRRRYIRESLRINKVTLLFR